MKRCFAPAVLGMALVAAAGCGGSGGRDGHPAPQRLNGAGSTFVEPMMQKWASLYQKEKGAEINYQGLGSGTGVDKMTSKDVQFGCTDAPLTEDQLQKAHDVGGEVVQIPLVMGGVVPAYHLKDVEKPLRFTGPVLADIFLGTLTKWNDPKLQALNPGVTLPDLDIAVVHRAEGSGTTFIWTEYLSKVSPEWKEKVGFATNVNWPCGVGQRGNPGMAGHIDRTPGAIGYIELIYAKQKSIKYGSVQNQAKEFIEASLPSVTAAAAAALADKLPDDLRFSITDAPGKESYPISGTVWAVLYVEQPADTGKAVVDFLRWVTHEGQTHAEELLYAKLPTVLVGRLEKKLDLVKVGK